jgi:aminopeptidase YwaD
MRGIVKWALFLTVMLIAGSVASGELFKVSLSSQADADRLLETGAQALFWLPDGYLVLADMAGADMLRRTGLEIHHLASDVSREQLVLDKRFDRLNAARFPVIFEEGGIRVLLVAQGAANLSGEPIDVFPFRDKPVPIQYTPANAAGMRIPQVPDLNGLISNVNQDSLESYVERLEAFTHRLTGTDSNYAARDWIEAKFEDFGYDSVVIDPFTGSQLWDRIPCQSYNVIAYKVGSVYPDQQVIVGGHFDAVPDCPGADDNGSGTACVLEIARVLHDVDLPMTFIFITFDSEESWMWGSYHYADAAALRGDDIILMVNPDMIAHWENNDFANLYYGAENAYALLWQALADSLVDIYGSMSGSTASDHLPFQEHGWPVIFVQEGIFSTHYHQPSDSAVYLNFEYMTRMVQATLATAYVTSFAPAPIDMVSVFDVGDGSSLQVTWEAGVPGQVDYYRLYWAEYGKPWTEAEVDVPGDQTVYLLAGLVDGREYSVRVMAVNADGFESIGYDELVATPRLVPIPPEDLTALPVHDGIRLIWRKNNTELDFDHYTVFRDGEPLPYVINDTIFFDYDPSLGTDFYDYLVAAVDLDGYQSDTIGLEPAQMRAATLEPGKILSVNRTTNQSGGFSDEVVTGEFLREALAGYDYTYCSDTAGLVANANDTLNLVEMIDYGIMIIGAEGRVDELVGKRLLDTLAYYLSIGGRAVIFGRWWDAQQPEVFWYDDPDDENHAYYSHLHIRSRHLMESPLVSGTIQSELIGAHSQVTGYPDLVWDSIASCAHTQPFEASGIPFASYVELGSGLPEIVYTFDARDAVSPAEGQPVGWRYPGPGYMYVFFEFPLTFMEHGAAVMALRKAVEDLGATGPSGCCLNIRGNANGDLEDKVNISDITYLVEYLFGIPTGPAPVCQEEGNANGDIDEKVNVSDVSYLIAYLFGIPSGPAPPDCPVQ